LLRDTSSTLFPYTTLFRSCPSRSRSPATSARPSRRSSMTTTTDRRHLVGASLGLAVGLVALVTGALVLREHGPGNMWAGYLAGRSEEHTSELQSRENLVCR